jgi:hypothetical protein
VPDATFTGRDLTTFARLDELGLVVAGRFVNLYEVFEARGLAESWDQLKAQFDL